ncbi:basic proline-rich protein-like [Canis lupus familiaris]|uniref:basic proline-rich protein-like n=1 Tax=Canis lupus familiaris TaxID=9615 RepID=UPI0018F3965F|nr:basic proline-rich protein-like [Canis lupus familiaris]
MSVARLGSDGVPDCRAWGERDGEPGERPGEAAAETRDLQSGPPAGQPASEAKGLGRPDGARQGPRRGHAQPPAGPAEPTCRTARRRAVKTLCVGRESNPGQLLEGSYAHHYTTNAAQPGPPRTPAQAPHQRLLALSPPPPPPCRSPAPTCRRRSSAPSRAHQRPPGAHPSRHPHAALAAPQARPPAASSRPPLGGALAALRLPGPRLPPGSRAAVRRVSEEPVAASLPSGGPGWAGPSPNAPGRQGARADEEGQGVRGVGSTAGRTGPRGRPAPLAARGRAEARGRRSRTRRRRGEGGPWGPAYVWAERRRRPRPKGGVSRLPVGESNPGLPRDRRGTHHYTNEDGGGGRPGARPPLRPPARPAGLPACPRHPGPRRPARPSCQGPATCPGPRPTRPDPPAAASARTAVPRPDSERRAPGPAASPRPRPAARGWRAGEDARHGKQGMARASRSPARDGRCGRRGAAGGGAGGPDARRGCAPREGGGGGGEDRGEVLAAPAESVGGPLASSTGPPPYHLPPPARWERGGPHGLSFPPAPIHSVVSTPLRPRGAHEAWPPGGLTTGHTPARRAAEPSARQPETGPPPRSLGLARGGGVGSTPPLVAPGSPERKAACLPGPPPRRKPLRAGAPGRQRAPSPRRPPASQPAAAPPKRTCRPHPQPQPSSAPDGELRAELTRPFFGLLAWALLGGPPISDDDTDADTHQLRAPTSPPPHPAAPRERTQSELRAPAGPRRRALHGPESHPPMGLRVAAGREGKVRAVSCAGHRRPALPGNRARVRLGQAASSRQGTGVWRRPRPRERAQGEPSPPRASLGPWAPRAGPSPSPSPSPSPRRICTVAEPVLQTAGPPARPRAAGAHHWPCRDDDERRWGSRLVAAATALAATLHPAARPLPPDVAQPRDALYGHLAAVSFKHGPLPTAKVTASTRSMQPSQHRRQHTQPRGTAPPPRLSPARRVHERRRTSMGITAKGTEDHHPTPAPAPAPAPGLPPPCQKQLYQQQQQQQQQQQRDVPTASRPA